MRAVIQRVTHANVAVHGRSNLSLSPQKPPSAQSAPLLRLSTGKEGLRAEHPKTTGVIGRGLVVLLAIEKADTKADIEWLSGKIVRLRVFDDEAGVMNRSVQEVGGEILLVSQFTLLASTRRGNRPSYARSAKPDDARRVYEQFIARLREDFGGPVQTGEFGGMMLVTLANDGPVTIIIDSKTRE